MKRSRRVVLTMMGTAAVGAVSMGFVKRGDCGPGRIPELRREPDGRLREYCVSYGGFGGGPHRLHAHFHGRGGHAHGGG
ncbi:hypothetical protein [Bradyrhizobium sp.]|jgi:hypothetical protein|uniref:hypothetical protein n=1 Tax=Bradyrhizobium sp. TaxID=376 RepID=UPI0025C03207|nr:hypothetical protein [Bradyrhizobium sp.]